MIIDFHTHIFPPEVCADRERFLGLDETFRELYSNPKARLATADDLLQSMAEAGVDASVALNFAWQDASLCRRTNDYILEAASASGGRLIPFCSFVNSSEREARDEIERCVGLGARGLGELRPENTGCDLTDGWEGELLAWAARDLKLPLLLHVTEPVGHAYPGKEGLRLESMYSFIEKWPKACVVAAHWGGGLPVYALMPRVQKMISHTYFDTAATHLLYRPEIYRQAASLVGIERIVFGSDYPYLSQLHCIQHVQRAPLSEEERRLVLGGNAARLLGLA